MIKQITKQEFKTLASSTTRNLKFYLLKDSDIGFSVDLFEIDSKSKEVSVIKKDDVEVKHLKYFLQKKDSYPVYHLVDKPVGYLRESFGDDNAKDFLALCNRLYYMNLKSEETQDIIEQLVGIFKSQAEIASGILDKEFEQNE
jgi:hypothetical protein